MNQSLPPSFSQNLLLWRGGERISHLVPSFITTSTCPPISRASKTAEHYHTLDFRVCYAVPIRFAWSMNPIKIQLWMVWISLFSATLSYRFILGTESPKEEPLDITLATISFLLILGSLACRILVLPKVKNQFPIFIVGLCLAESVSFFAIFLMPYYQDLFMTLSLVSILVFLPSFIKLPEND